MGCRGMEGCTARSGGSKLEAGGRRDREDACECSVTRLISNERLKLAREFEISPCYEEGIITF